MLSILFGFPSHSQHYPTPKARISIFRYLCLPSPSPKGTNLHLSLPYSPITVLQRHEFPSFVTLVSHHHTPKARISIFLSLHFPKTKKAWRASKLFYFIYINYRLLISCTKILLTSCGFACPFVCFITWPTRKPIALPLPFL